MLELVKWNLWSLLAGCVVGMLWGVALTYSHALSFAESICRNCANDRHPPHPED